MKRDRKIMLGEMRSIMKELRALAEELQVELKIHHYPIKFVPELYCYPDGVYDGLNNQITIRIYGRPGRRLVLHSVAHELRHAMQDRDGLFKDYYRNDVWKLVRDKQFLKIKKPFNTKTAWLAERDCDNWADKFLASKGIRPIKNKYFYRATAAYQVRGAILRAKNELKRSKKRSK